MGGSLAPAGTARRLEEMFLNQLEDPAVNALVELAREKAFGVTQAVEVVYTEYFRPRAGCGPAHVAQVVVDDPFLNSELTRMVWKNSSSGMKTRRKKETNSGWSRT